MINYRVLQLFSNIKESCECECSIEKKNSFFIDKACIVTYHYDLVTISSTKQIKKVNKNNKNHRKYVV